MATEEFKVDEVPESEIVQNIPDEVRELQTELINLNTKLVFAVATCDCPEKDDCDVYVNSKEIAKVLKKLQDAITVVPREQKSKTQRRSRK